MDNVITTTAAAQLTLELPSRIRVPACGHTQSEGTRVPTATGRMAGAVKADMGFAVASTPGNHAWRPPKS